MDAFLINSRIPTSKFLECFVWVRVLLSSQNGLDGFGNHCPVILKILIDLIWVYPLQLGKVVARLGGMHFLMSFIGCIGNLLVNSGLIDILKSAFGGVEKMLTG